MQPVEAEIEVPFLTAVRGGTITFEGTEGPIELKVPAGSEDGKKMRLRGQAPGGADLILHLRLLPHPYFRREGNNVLLDVPLTITEATLGTKVDVPTVGGDKLTVTIKPGASSGSRRRLPGFGVSGGDMYLVVQIVTPTTVDARARELLEELARVAPQNPRTGEAWQ
jgi:DnaJ-class molecular chaperone